MKIIGSSLLLILVLAGCCNTTLPVCPSYPKPSSEVLIKLRSMHSAQVNRWMIEQLRLKRKLEVCNGYTD